MDPVFDSPPSEDHRPDLRGPADASESPLRPEQSEFVGWLENNAAALVPLYRGALALATFDSFPGRAHFIAHAIREIRNRLAGALGREDALALLSAQGPVPAYVVENWRKLYRDVQAFAHARDEPLPTESDGEWVAKFFAFEQILMALSKRSYENLDDLDALLERTNARTDDWTVPSEDDVDQVVALAARLENRTYLFDRLENPKWVAALDGRGFFADAPDPVPADEPGYVQFPPWPEGRYLVRMTPVAPFAVAEALKELPPSANSGVTRCLLECVQALPSERFQELAPQTAKWITDPVSGVFFGYCAEEAAAAISRLMREGMVKQGLKAAKKLLSLKPRPGDGEKDGRTWTRLPEPVGRLSDWAYEQAIKKMLPDLVDAAGIKGVELLSRLLTVAVNFNRHQDEPPDSDGHSVIWRPAIEDHSQNSDHGVRCVVVTAVRDAAVRLGEVSEEDLQAVVEMLEAGTVLHRRIALHVLAVVAGGADLAAERIANRDIFEDYRLKHEYAELLRSRLGASPPEARSTFLDWVTASPDVDGFRRHHEERTGSVPTPEDEAAHAERWKRNWLSIVACHLSGDEAEAYSELVAKHGEARHPDFLSWRTVRFGDGTPLATEDMDAMSADAVIDYLASWEPDEGAGWGLEPTMRGLGRTFERVVAGRAADFAAVANQLEALDPTYVRSFLSGLETAVKAGVSVPWDQLIRLMASVLEHPFDHEEDTPENERDPGWSWTRGQAASLIQEGVADRDNRIPFELRQPVWSVLKPLTHDPNPTPEDETDVAGHGSMDPFTESINTNRSKAMHAVMAYALWCRRELDARDIGTGAGFDLIPEVRAVLEEHLDPGSEPSLAVRAVYGKWLPWLILLDEAWTAANIALIVPPAPELAAFRDAAWNTYVGWCPPFDQVYDALAHEYEAAVERVPSEGTVDLAGDDRADAKLGEHLVEFYWRGCPRPALLERWFERADDELAARVMHFLGMTLYNTEEDIDPAVLQRIQQLWDTRLEAIARDPEAHKSEADAFAYTFASAKLDDDWSLAGLEITLRTESPRWSGQPVIERLANVAATRPAEATRCTMRMLQGASNDWDHLGWRDQVRDVLAATSHTADPGTIENRNTIVAHYVTRGDHEFRDCIFPQQ